MFNSSDYSFGQLNNSVESFDKAKSSSDEALSLIDSLKGSSLLNSVVDGMKNISSFSAKRSNYNGGDLMSSSSNPNTSALSNTNAISVTNPMLYNKTTSFKRFNPVDNNTKGGVDQRQSLVVLPYPMTIPSKDYIPLYSSLPSKILNGNILTKLPCNTTKPTLQIVGSSADNNMFPINLDLIPNLSRPGSMCMYQSIIPDNLSNLLYSHTLTSLYLYNSLDFPIEVPTTTSIFIGIQKLTE